MKHSKKDRSSRHAKGFSKGKNNDSLPRLAPITIEEILADTVEPNKKDMTIREMVIRTDPTNDSSPVIKRKFNPLDNPATVLEVLQGLLIIKEGVIGNNVTTGPLMYAYWRGCMQGTAQRKFNEFATAVGTETIGHLQVVEQRLVAFFSPREVLSQQTRYIRYSMRKPYGTTTRQYVGGVHTLNDTLGKLPPNYVAGQKIPDRDLMEILASNAPKSHKELMTDHGFDPQTATFDTFIEICERAETKEQLSKRKSKQIRYESDDSDSESDSKRHKKHKKQSKTRSNRAPYYCKEHGPNTTHDSKDCKVLANRDTKSDWKKKPKDQDKYKDYQSKYKKKSRELNLLQLETKQEKSKYTKLRKKLQASTSAKTEEAKSDGEASKDPGEERTFTPREELTPASSKSSSSSASASSSSSSSASSTDSE